jgi:hypothetical protein
MGAIFPFHSRPADWQALLANPAKQWRSGFSARTLAHCWAEADGFPPEVASALSTASAPLFAGLTPILGIPEFEVPLKGGDRASQNDIFVLARSHAGPVSIMVEGKVDEAFGPLLGDWLEDASPASGKKDRLAFLLKTLGLAQQPADTIRYQLLHRAASAVLAGEQYHAVAAVLVVHSFSRQEAGRDDFAAFCRLFGTTPEAGHVERLPGEQAVPLFAVWVPGDQRFLVA